MESAPQSRQTLKQDSNFHRYTLDAKSTQGALKLLYDVISSCRGPNGKIKMVQNTAGGHLTITSKSERLFHVMSVTKPVLKLIVTASQGHLQCFKDGGNFVVTFCLSLILQSVKSSLNRKLIIHLFEEFLNISFNYLDSDDCTIKMKLKVSDLNHMSTVLKSILTSKPLCRLYGNNLHHISRLVLETFLNSLPSGDNCTFLTDCINIICFDGLPVSDSKSLKGLLLEFPEIPPYSKHGVKLKNLHFNGKLGIRCVVVTVSMSGDTEEMMELKYEVDKDTRMDSAILSRLIKFCGLLVEHDVGLLFCQKVVHPKLKQFCRAKNVKVVDRLGLQGVQYVLDVTGAVPIPSLDKLDADALGWLNSVEHTVLNHKSYLYLMSDSPVTTLVLCNTEEESVQELKAVCMSSLTTLRQLLSSPQVLAGGGCWEVHLASVLRKQVLANKDKFMQLFGCSKTTLFSVCEIFAHSLELVAMALGDEDVDHMTDRSSFHFWRVPKGSTENESFCCGCGINETAYSSLTFLSDQSLTRNFVDAQDSECPNKVENDPEMKESVKVVDLFSSSINALQTAVMTASSILSINQYIEDTN